MSELADSNISLVNDVFVKQMHFRKKGWVAVSHLHRYDHQSLLASGRLLITVDGETREFVAPAIMVIHAGKLHRMEAVEDNTLAYCIHAVKGGETIDEAEPLVIGTENKQLVGLAT